MTEYVSPFAADFIGFAGSFFIVAAFAYSNLTTQMNALWFNVANLLGAALLTISLMVNFNLPTMVLEIVWMGIAVLGIMKALTKSPVDTGAAE
ncbi:CBU_0592 family membrane protein [Sphingorhabdus sp.]|uniref:CBU_0592 family membrane protein n=1 Tax=Sphingorhabdus sp. TaxID=1902408 RepID=UPI002FD96986